MAANAGAEGEDETIGNSESSSDMVIEGDDGGETGDAGDNSTESGEASQ